MEEKDSLYKKAVALLDLKKIVCAVRIMGRREKLAFFLLLAIFLSSLFYTLWLINQRYLIEIPARGGSVAEGILGTPRFINPLLAISDVDRDLSALIYSGLMRPDGKGGLELDLAEKYETSKDGLTYTFTLKPKLRWQDGYPITADDIIFTVRQAQDPLVKSPRRASWEGVEVEKVDERTVKFKLQKPYAPFLENTTIGIIPKHIWKDVPPEKMALSDFNIIPVGSGPYKIKTFKKDSSGIILSYTLESYKKFALGEPYIRTLKVFFFPTREELFKAYTEGKVDLIGAVSPQEISYLDKERSKLLTLNLPRIFGIFFNQNQNKIFAKKEVRLALELATDKKRIVDKVFKGFATELYYPLPPGVFGGISPKEDEESFSLEAAKELLEKNGWKFDEEEKIWKKKTKKENLELKFSIATSNIPELKSVAEEIKSMWEKLGAQVELKFFEIGDLNQNIIRPREYDALLFGEILGNDPDPFVFWHSSQRNDPGLNISGYANIKVDKLLEEARTLMDPSERKEKYEKFQKIVREDMPAIFLYSPKFIYIAPLFLKGIESTTKNINNPSERFSQIYRWYIKTDKVWKKFIK